MTTAYPGGIDSFTNPTGSDTLDSVTVPHATQHADLNDAVEAIETELGVDPAGAAATVVARLNALDTTVSGKIGATLAADLNAASYDIYSVDQLALGSTVGSSTSLKFGRTATVSGVWTTLTVSEVLTWSSAGFNIYTGIDYSPTLTFNASMLGVKLLRFSPNIAGSATGYAIVGIESIAIPPASSAVSKYTAFAVGGGRAADTVLTVGLDIGVTTALAATTVWGIQCADYQSYHHGRFTLGATTAPTYALDIQGTAQDRGVIALKESSATPTNPSSSDQALIYLKADKLVLAFNNAGTVRYKYLDLTGTGVTWVHTTTAP